MAFQLALDALSQTSHRDSSLHPVLDSVMEPMRNSLTTFPWMVPNDLQPFLLQAGIQTSGLGTTPHPHPVHKVLETNLLFNHWHFLAKTPSSVLFMKPEKFNKLQKRNPNFSELLNYRVTPNDSVRYPTTSPHLPKTDVVFMHDALMYYTPEQVLDVFLRIPNLQKLFCSLVVPPESEFTNLSLSPNLYTFQLHNQTLHYIPENHYAGSYNQPLSAIQWLKISSIHHPQIQLSVTILESWGPLHSILIQRGLPSQHLAGPNLFSSLLHPLPSPAADLISFKIPECIELPQSTFLSQPLRHRLIPKKAYDALFTYTRAVRTLRTSDPAGFVRTQSNKPEYSWVTSNAWDNLQTFALLNCAIRPNVVYNFLRNPFQKLKIYLSQHWRRIVAVSAPTLSFLTLLPHFLNWSLSLPKVKCISAFRHRFDQPPPQPLALQIFHKLVNHLPPQVLQTLSKVCQTLHLPSPLPPPRPGILPSFRISHSAYPIRFPTWLSLLACLVPELLVLGSKLTGDLSVQQQHDLYHHHLHPAQYHLQWERLPYSTTSRQNFLPFEPVATPSPPQAPLAQPPPKSRSTSPQHFTSPSWSSTQLSPHLSPLPTQPSSPPPDFINIPVSPSTTFRQPTTSFLTNSSPRTRSLYEYLLQYYHPGPPPLPQPASNGCHCEPCTQSEASSPTQNFPLQDPSSPYIVPPDPSTPIPEPPLLKDLSCTGPILSFQDLYPRNYYPNTALFLTRLRITPPKPLPLPPNDCLLQAISPSLSVSPSRLWLALQEIIPDCLLDNEEVHRLGLSTDLLTALCHYFNFKAEVISDGTSLHYGISDSPVQIQIIHTSGSPGHYSPPPKLTGATPPREPPHPLTEQLLRFKFKGAHLPFSKVHSYSSSVAHAKNLVSNMKNGFDGILSLVESNVKHAPGCSPRDKIIMLDRLLDNAAPRSVHLIHIAGFAGCGKTHPLQHLLRTKPFHNFRVSVPTTDLRNEWKKDMALPSSQSHRFNTWESSLFKHSNILVIDEIYKLPRGYLDLSIHSDPSISLIILLGDPLQGEYHSTSPHSSNHLLQSETERLSQFIDHYCWWTYRVPSHISDLFNVPSYNQSHGPFFGTVRLASSYSPGQHNLVNSMATSAAVNQLGYPSCTISSSQGMTFRKHVTILLDKHSRLLSPSNTLVALTRSTAGVEFLGDPMSLSGTNNSSDMFSRAMHQMPINLATCFPRIFHKLNLLREPIKHRSKRLLGSRPPSPIYLNPKKMHLPPHIPIDYALDYVLHNPHVFGSKDDPRLECNFLPPTRLALHSDLISANPSVPSLQPVDSDFRTPITPVYPGETFENLAAFFLPAHDPELKEILYKDQNSQQFPWFDRPFELSCQPSSLIAARHSPSQDPTLLPSSIKKRLRFRPSDNPHQFSADEIILGNHLFHSLCRAYNRNPNQTLPFNPSLFAECIALNDYAQLSSKTKSTIVANASRSDPDWRHTAVKIFAKSQHKVNDGSIFGPWKACQTLALMHDFVILSLGPVKKYQRLFDQADRPSHLYTHCGKTPQDLSLWCSAHLSHKTKVTNDYTAFDQSQHGESVILEALKMKRLSIPEHLILLHIHLKTNVSTQFGPLTCMRLTGEPGTYDDNTDYNIAVLYSQYNLQNTPVMVSGDDSLIDSKCPELLSWPTIQSKLHLRFKTETTDYPLFCGYYVGSSGAIRNPLALFAKLMIAIDDQSISEKRLSYITEFSVGHSLGDSFWDLLPSEIHPYQSACFDYFCRNSPPHEKSILHNLPFSPTALSTITSSIKWLSKSAFSALPMRIRRAAIEKSQLPSSHENPEVSRLESELLHNFQ
ncbi:replicase [Asclepias asymptomatic virus]|uniref:replicase n=1 Tax=Asclepias asymptomatic virus TaxID=1027880 RepID=UPI00020B10FC|nr:replicase [Asclepias asymptomatic virus]AEE02009.1 replicase [Asclepias asymptomatic virus]